MLVAMQRGILQGADTVILDPPLGGDRYGFVGGDAVSAGVALGKLDRGRYDLDAAHLGAGRRQRQADCTHAAVELDDLFGVFGGRNDLLQCGFKGRGVGLEKAVIGVGDVEAGQPLGNVAVARLEAEPAGCAGAGQRLGHQEVTELLGVDALPVGLQLGGQNGQQLLGGGRVADGDGGGFERDFQVIQLRNQVVGGGVHGRAAELAAVGQGGQVVPGAALVEGQL